MIVDIVECNTLNFNYKLIKNVYEYLKSYEILIGIVFECNDLYYTYYIKFKNNNTLVHYPISEDMHIDHLYIDGFFKKYFLIQNIQYYIRVHIRDNNILRCNAQ